MSKRPFEQPKGSTRIEQIELTHELIGEIWRCIDLGKFDDFHGYIRQAIKYQNERELALAEERGSFRSPPAKTLALIIPFPSTPRRRVG